MNTVYLVNLTDITPNRATVTSLERADSEDAAMRLDSAPNYAVVTDPSLVPILGERVWIDNNGQSRGRRTITGRA